MTEHMEKTVPIKKKRRFTMFDIVLGLILAIICILFFYPLYYIFLASFSDPAYVFNNPILIVPHDLTLYNYQMMAQ